MNLIEYVIETIIAEIKSSAYIIFELSPKYTYDNGRHLFKLPNGKLHRLDGPAYSFQGTDVYSINGIKYTPSEFWEKMKDTKYSKKIIINVLGSKNKDNK